ncbi:MAG: twin-arginine translocase TatA/TatE family subunit [Actinomycetota bacterium]
MFSGLTGWHLLALLAIVVLIFGATRLPGLAKGLGQSIKIFRNEIKPTDADTGKSDSAAKPDAEPDSKSDKPAA